MGDDVQSIDINGSIALERGFEMELHTPRCPDLVIDDPCIVNATVRNTGNFDDVADVVLTLTEQAEGIVVLEPGTTRMALAPGAIGNGQPRHASRPSRRARLHDRRTVPRPWP